MADVTIGGIGGTGIRSPRGIVATSASTLYKFHGGTGLSVIYLKSTDSGATWGSAVTIKVTTTAVCVDVYWDQNNPGDSGTLIHIAYFDTGDDTVYYRTLDTSSDTIGTERTVFTGATSIAGRGAFCSVVKTLSGYIYVCYDIDAGTETGFRRSTDGGVNWSGDLGGSATALVEATIDECILLPAFNTGDNNDCWAVYQDASADALTMKMYDSSAATVIESSTMQTMVENVTDLTGQRGFAASIRKSDGHLFVVSCSERDTATADMQVWDVSAVNSGSLTGITAKTDITTNIDDIYYPQVFIDQATNNIYVAYNGKRDGSEVLGTTTKVYYTKSTDGGTSWTAGDTAYMEGAATTVLQLWTPLMGLRFCAAWRSGTSVFINAVNSLDLTPSSVIKTMDGLIKASVKTVDGLAVASVKTVLGAT